MHITAVSHGRRLAPIDEGLRLADEYLALGPHLVRVRLRLRLRLRVRLLTSRRMDEALTLLTRTGEEVLLVRVRIRARFRVRVRLRPSEP